MSSRKSIRSAVTRWGLLVTTITLAVFLVALGVLSFFGARQASDSVIRARSMDMVVSVRRALAQSGGDHQSALDDVLEELEERGLRYAAVVVRQQGVVIQAGRPAAALETGALRRVARGSAPTIEPVDGRYRVYAQVGRRLGTRRPYRDKLIKREWEQPWRQQKGAWNGQQGGGVLDRWANKGDGTARGGRARGTALLVLEFEPVVVTTIQNRALAMLIISLATATLLLVAAVFFWRLSRKADKMSAQLARDRQLKALGEMSAVLGHELRNPLASLKGHAQLLVERLGDDHPGSRGANFVVKEALRMETLTEQVLEFARTGSVQCSPEDPAEVARSASEQAGLAGINVHADESLPACPMDRLRIERVLINLLRNAVQASPSEGEVDLTVVAADGGLLFEVRDHGDGLPPGEEEWIFEPFHTKRVKGTGLGLAVSKRIVDAHNGHISAGNHPKGGAVFRFWLPA